MSKNHVFCERGLSAESRKLYNKAEYESQAGWYFIGFLGTPLILCFAIAVKFLYFKEAKPA